jgi:hypothetical protein
MTSSSSSNIMGDEPFKKSCLTFPKKTRRTFSTRNTSGISCARSYRTLRDDSFRGTLFQALRARLQSVLSLRDALADISQQYLGKRLCTRLASESANSPTIINYRPLPRRRSRLHHRPPGRRGNAGPGLSRW